MRIRCLIFYFGMVLFSRGTVWAQNLQLIDSLKRNLPAASNERRFELLNAIGFEFRYSYSDSTIHYCTMAYALGQKTGIKKGLSRPLSFIGLAKANQGDYKGSLEYHNRSIETASMQNDTLQLAHGYNNVGRIYMDEGDLARAYSNFIRAKDLFDNMHDKSGLAYVYRSMADLFKSKKEFAMAMDNSRQALILRKELGDPRAITSALMELGLVYEEMDSTPLALKQFELADSMAALMQDKITMAELRIGMAEILFVEKRIEEAEFIVREVLSIVTENINQKIYLRARMLMARFESEMKKPDQALAILNQVFESAEKSGNLVFQQDAAELLSNIYNSQRNLELANKFRGIYQILTSKIQNADLNREIEKLQFQLQIEKTEKENESLRAQQANDESVIAQQRFQNILLIIILVFIAVTAILIRSVSQKRRKINQRLEEQNLHILHQREEIAKQNEILIRHNHQLDDLNHQKDTLMNIVAHDLKSPFNRILGLSNILEMEGNLNPEQQEYVRLLKESTRSGLDLITDLLDVHAWAESRENLKPVPFEFDQWFNERIQLFLPVAELKGSTIMAKSRVGRKLISEPSYLGRILDNLISNAIKFSPRNTGITAEATWENGSLELVVIDKGPGFTAEDQKSLYQKFKKLSARPTAGESSNGLGLAIVKTLVDRLGGDIELKTSRQGSEFVIRIPAKIFQESLA